MLPIVVHALRVPFLAMTAHSDDIRPEQLGGHDSPKPMSHVDPATLPPVRHGRGTPLPDPETVMFPRRRNGPVVVDDGTPSPDHEAPQTTFSGTWRFSGFAPGILAMDMDDTGVTWSKVPNPLRWLGVTIKHDDGSQTEVTFPTRTDDMVDEWVAGKGEMGDLDKNLAAWNMSLPDPCRGAAVLTRGCRPQRHTQRVDTFSTDVQEIQRQQLMIGACLVAPAVAVYGVVAGFSASESLATLVQWARPLASTF